MNSAPDPHERSPQEEHPCPQLENQVDKLERRRHELQVAIKDAIDALTHINSGIFAHTEQASQKVATLACELRGTLNGVHDIDEDDDMNERRLDPDRPEHNKRVKQFWEDNPSQRKSTYVRVSRKKLNEWVETTIRISDAYDDDDFGRIQDLNSDLNSDMREFLKSEEDGQS